jgi:RNA polymerase sigma-70 factor (ECF subfamily)
MFALALRKVGDRAEAEDIVQEALARAYHCAGQFDGQHHLSTWLYRIVLNCCRDFLKSPRRLEQPVDPARNDIASSPAPEDHVLRTERSRQLSAAIAKLRPSDGEILVQKHMMELSFQEIHELTGAPITSLKIRATRARERLRKLLCEDAGEP